MGPRGRGRGGGRGGNFRGRGGRGGGRGRGRGRGARSGGPSRLEMSRVDDHESSSDESMEEMSGSGEDEDLDDESGSEDEDDLPSKSSRPYMALLEGFNEPSERNAKRRKLDRGSAAVEVPPTETQRQPESEDEGEDDEDDGKDLDHVEEAEEEAAGALEGEEADSDDEDEEDATDPFDRHFTIPDESMTSKRVRAIKANEWSTKRTVTKVSKALVMSPNTGAGADISLPTSIKSSDDLKLKHRLLEVASKKMANLDEFERAMAPMLFGYHDIMYGERTVRNADSLRQLVCLHAINHVFKTRDRVIKNNAKLSKDESPDMDFKDQGFTRPKVLFLLPTRNSAAKMARQIEELVEPDQRENRTRFEDTYIQKSEKFRDEKTADFLDMFDGNDDDMFRLGVKFTRKTIKYFAQFYNSDILMASPLGLRMAIGSEEEKKATDYDFLSSIELVVVDQADGLLMQNWEHVEYIFEHLNLQPKDSHGCDFSRVRSWYLEDWAKYFRQTVILSPFITPELTELFRTQCHNWAGKIRFHPEYQGALQQLPVKARQTFSRFESKAIDKDPDARFAYFTSAILPSLVKRAKEVTGTVIFIPSYLDFVRVRNYFATNTSVETLSYGHISEYAEAAEAARARSHFLSGRHKVLLYTERAHHFRRYKLRGVQRVIMYGLPENPIFYKEIAGDYLARSEHEMKLEPGQGAVRVMFSKYDAMKLERVVGTQRVGKMIQDRGDTFDFV